MGGGIVDALPVTTDTVLQLLRQLPPRERLHVVAQALPELERDLPGVPPALDFWCGIDVRILAERHGIRPVENWDALLGGWPDDEPIDDFITTLREWRRQSLVEEMTE